MAQNLARTPGFPGLIQGLGFPLMPQELLWDRTRNAQLQSEHLQVPCSKTVSGSETEAVCVVFSNAFLLDFIWISPAVEFAGLLRWTDGGLTVVRPTPNRSGPSPEVRVRSGKEGQRGPVHPLCNELEMTQLA